MISLEKKTILYTSIIILVYIFVRYYYYQGKLINKSKNNFLNTDIIQNRGIGGKKDISTLFTNLFILNNSVFNSDSSDLENKFNNKIDETKNNQINVENKFNKLVNNMINEIIFDSKKKINNISYDIMYKTSKY